MTSRAAARERDRPLTVRSGTSSEYSSNEAVFGRRGRVLRRRDESRQRLRGRALGLRGGQFLDYRTSPRPFGDFWLTVAQAYMSHLDTKSELAEEIFMKQHGESHGLLPGVWRSLINLTQVSP